MKKIMFNDRYGLTEAVLTGRKTQTRRIAYDFRKHASNKVGKCVLLSNNNLTYKDGDVQVLDELRSPQYQVGEVVAVAQCYKDCGYGECAPIVSLDENGIATFGSDAGSYNKMFVRADLMPHHIRITNVRVERLQDISDEDCIKEGIDKWTAQGKRYYGFFDNSKGVFSNHRTPRDAYAALIDRISGKGTWESNPYVFVYDFELVKMRMNMIATTQGQSQRLLRCGVSADTADMTLSYCKGGFYELMATPFHYGCFNEEDVPAWSLSALLGLLPFKVHNGKYEYWLDIAPMDYGKQWSIGYYCMDKPRVIKGLTHTDSLIECAVQEIEWLTSNGYKLNEI